MKNAPYWIETDNEEGRTPRRNKKKRSGKSADKIGVMKDILCRQVKELSREIVRKS